MSRASRFLITTIPADAYVKDEETGVNLTLQKAAQVITESFQRLASAGIPVYDLPSLGGNQAAWLLHHPINTHMLACGLYRYAYIYICGYIHCS